MLELVRVGMVVGLNYQRAFDFQESARVEALGADWIVLRDENGNVHFDTFDGAAEDHFQPFIENEEPQR